MPRIYATKEELRRKVAGDVAEHVALPPGMTLQEAINAILQQKAAEVDAEVSRRIRIAAPWRIGKAA